MSSATNSHGTGQNNYGQRELFKWLLVISPRDKPTNTASRKLVTEQIYVKREEKSLYYQQVTGVDVKTGRLIFRQTLPTTSKEITYKPRRVCSSQFHLHQTCFELRGRVSIYLSTSGHGDIFKFLNDFNVELLLLLLLPIQIV